MKTKPEATYRIRTWDMDKQKFTPQNGVPSICRGALELRQAMRALQRIGYSCHRFKGRDSDPSVLIERVEKGTE